MRDSKEIKSGLFVALKHTVNNIFKKRKFNDNFTPKEMEKVKEIDSFLREICLFKEMDALTPYYKSQHIFICCRTRMMVRGTEFKVFYNKPIPFADFDYKKIEYYVAKAIYRTIQHKKIEVFYTPNNFRFVPDEEKKYHLDRKKENVTYTGSVFMDVDLDGSLASMTNDMLLAYLKKEYEEFFLSITTHLHYTKRERDAYVLQSQ